MEKAARILVIGYGNELRRDDGAGPRVAEAVADWRLDNVRALTCHQLTPELSEPISAADAVIFADAILACDSRTVAVTPIQPSATSEILAHTCDPRALLGLARAVFSRCPRALCLTIPGEDFEMGEQLSPLAERGVRAALDLLRRWCGAIQKGGEGSIFSVDAQA